MTFPFDVTCRRCQRVYTIEATQEQLADWRSGTLIQRALPHLTADEREMLMTQTCGQCFDEMFACKIDETDY